MNTLHLPKPTGLTLTLTEASPPSVEIITESVRRIPGRAARTAAFGC